MTTPRPGQMHWDEFFTGLSDDQLAFVWSRSMQEMRSRELVRSSNNPVADYGERVVADLLDLELAPKVAQGYDATKAGVRYQIKSRRLTSHNKSRQLGVIRKLDQREFDEVVAILFDEELTVLEVWQVPYDAVVDHATWVPTLNGHRMNIRPPLTEDPRVRRLR